MFIKQNDSGQDIPYCQLRDDEPVELYSDDGYSDPEDIARWADTIEDIVDSRAAGNTSYSITWNIKQ